jgi:methylornithine synthase
MHEWISTFVRACEKAFTEGMGRPSEGRLMLSDLKKTNSILARVEAGGSLEHGEICYLLALTDPFQMANLFAAARRMRQRFFGDSVFLYGFVYFSTFCKNECRFCHYRKSNARLLRYRKNDEAVIDISRRLKVAGVHLIDLTMGEDPSYVSCELHGESHLVELVRKVKAATHLPIMVSPGVISDGHLVALADAGADFYACYQETHSIKLYKNLRSGQDFETRMRCKRRAKKYGMRIEEGIMTGVGEVLDDLAHSIKVMRGLEADQVRVMTFIPQKNTPMSQVKYQGREQELVILAVLRLALPDRLIPASLDIDGLDGLKDRLDAGANVITSLVEPSTGLAGVANHALDIENARRTPNAILPIVKSCGLRKADQDEYNDWLDLRKKKVFYSPEIRSIAV